MPDPTPDNHGMIVIDGVRYRPEDAPKQTAAAEHQANPEGQADAQPEKAPAKKAPAAANKARTADTGGGPGDSDPVPTK